MANEGFAQRLCIITVKPTQRRDIESTLRVTHSFWPFLERPFKSSTTQRRSRLQHGYCIGVSRRSAEATAGKGLSQGPYVTARAGVEPTTLRLRVIASTNAPSRPTYGLLTDDEVNFLSLFNLINTTSISTGYIVYLNYMRTKYYEYAHIYTNMHVRIVHRLHACRYTCIYV